MSNTVRVNSQTIKPPILTQRYVELQAWLEEVLDGEFAVNAMDGDASFRVYYRVFTENKTYIAMDAPPDKESCDTFVAIAKTFKKCGIAVPEVYVENLACGFLLLEDLGDRLYLRELTDTTADELYARAFQTLIKIKYCKQIEAYALPSFDEALYRKEWDLFLDWYLVRYKKLNLSEQQLIELEDLFVALITTALEQPQFCVHRDFHSRNLLIWHEKVGVLDFQDAVMGPVTYDLVSLLRDCYIEWPLPKIEYWLQQYFNLLNQEQIINKVSLTQFTRWFDLMGLQRHLKCLGIFSRKYLRDHNSGYLQDIPRLLRYIKFVCERYPEFYPLHNLLRE